MIMVIDLMLLINSILLEGYLKKCGLGVIGLLCTRFFMGTQRQPWQFDEIGNKFK